VGNELNGDDAAGLEVVRGLGRKLSSQADLLLLETGLAPENFTGVLRRFQPDFVLFVDALEIEAPPGAIFWVDWRDLEGFSGSTHTLPLSILASYLDHEIGCQVAVLGIRAVSLEISGLTEPVRSTVDQICDELTEWWLKYTASH
jgi:hydrogenase maturation protease HycI